MVDMIKIYQKEEFKRTFNKIKKKVDKSLGERIEKTIQEKIVTDPKRRSGRIKANSMKPMRYLKIGKRRLYFIYCKECRNEGYTKKWNCPNCSDLNDETIILFDIDKRENAYSWQ